MREGLMVFVVCTVLLLIGCQQNGEETSSQAEPQADWPQYSLEEMIEEAELIALVHVNSVETEVSGEDDLLRQVAELEISEAIEGEPQGGKINLNQSTNFVEENEDYLMFLQQRDGYYYEVTNNAILVKEGDNYISTVVGSDGEFTKEELTEMITTN
ncbi:hypothetical protein FLK61_25585 [Paenalkalicoccus suaedae]|uniref:Uncharacterized protein n=1 Tax=Paenalkalicoccus suaedae TaxID=2592382 RepID=A0A859FD16_9BACI|nr:hypothetical protein [Paenalkalicoccus suaedae]QKS70145.1 hypothetical protein FLK61_25585 [Paenalkalicoccus suaedae]